jgi:HEAT repeat protein
MQSSRLLLLLAVAGALAGRDRIALIEFFGYQGLEVEAIRKALPVHEGDPYSDATKSQVREVVRRVSGRDATDVQGICCEEHGDRVLFVGLPGKSSREFRLNPRPAGSIRLSKQIAELYDRLYEAEEAAVRKGGDAAQEDASHGYRLVKDPPARKLELDVRQYALAHEAELEDVLKNCSDAVHRAIAADALGYVERSPQQISALVWACRDPDDDVRNNAARALGELLSADPTLAKQIPAAGFVEMIGSGVWSDRNKASFVLEALVKSDDPRLLEQIKSQTWEPLMEMARWRDTGHAATPRRILGRIQGIPEERLMQLAFGPPQQFLDALGIK